MEPGASRPKPGGDPSAPMDDAEIERALSSIESITSTLVQEVGRPPNRAAEAEARAAAAAEPADTATTVTAPRTDNAAPLADAQPLDAPAAASAPAQDASPRDLPPADDQPACQADPSGSPAEPLSAAEPTAVESDPSVAAEPAASPAAPAQPQLAASATEPASTDAEVEQEISQAIRHLQAGQPVAASTAIAPADAATARASILRRILRGLGRVANGAVAPLALLAFALDLPFRWMPAAIKQLLGYVAVGTALMAGALWYYIIIVKPH